MPLMCFAVKIYLIPLYTVSCDIFPIKWGAGAEERKEGGGGTARYSCLFTFDANKTNSASKRRDRKGSEHEWGRETKKGNLNAYKRGAAFGQSRYKPHDCSHHKSMLRWKGRGRAAEQLYHPAAPETLHGRMLFRACVAETLARFQ